MFVVFLDDDVRFAERLRVKLNALGLRARVLQARADLPAPVLADMQIALVCIRGLANRLVSLQDVATERSAQGALLLSKNMTESFVSLCLGLGARGVLDRRASSEHLARMIRAVASADVTQPA